MARTVRASESMTLKRDTVFITVGAQWQNCSTKALGRIGNMTRTASTWTCPTCGASLCRMVPRLIGRRRNLVTSYFRWPPAWVHWHRFRNGLGRAFVRRRVCLRTTSPATYRYQWVAFARQPLWLAGTTLKLLGTSGRRKFDSVLQMSAACHYPPPPQEQPAIHNFLVRGTTRRSAT